MSGAEILADAKARKARGEGLKFLYLQRSRRGDLRGCVLVKFK